MSIDPVCGMNRRSREGRGARRLQGKTYHFCSQHCVQAFEADPEKFLAGKQKQEPNALRLRRVRL